MKKLIEVIEAPGEGLESLLGERVLLICSRYFYAGKLTGVNKDYVVLEDAGIVYETGSWDKTSYTDFQKLPSTWRVQIMGIESFGKSK